MAVDSVTNTLAANVPQVRRLKILIHGQEVETLEGHLDLSQAFVVTANAVSGPRAAVANDGPAAASATPQTLTPAAAAVKLTPPAAQPCTARANAAQQREENCDSMDAARIRGALCSLHPTLFPRRKAAWCSSRDTRASFV